METFEYLVGRGAELPTWWQMSIRAVIVFVYALALYRILPKKAFNGSAVVDIVLTVIISSNLSRALTGNAPLVATLVATSLLALIHFLLSYLARRWEPISRLVKGRPVLIIRDGEVDWPALRLAQVGERDLEENLRLNGVRTPDDVAEAYLERNGAMSILKRR